MKITTLAANELFPEFPLNKEVDLELEAVGVGIPLHLLTFEDTSYSFEIKETIFISKNDFLIKGFIADLGTKKRLGAIAFGFSS